MDVILTAPRIRNAFIIITVVVYVIIITVHTFEASTQHDRGPSTGGCLNRRLTQAVPSLRTVYRPLYSTPELPPCIPSRSKVAVGIATSKC